MRRIMLGIPPASMHGSPEGKFVFDMLREIMLASYENDPAVVASNFTVSNFTETRSLDVSTATPTDLMNFVATLVLDLGRGGAKKGS